MSKPHLDVILTTADGKTSTANAVFDTGSYYSLLRGDKVPPGAIVTKQIPPQTFGTAAKGGQFSTTGVLPVILGIGDSEIDDVVLVAPELSVELIVGAGTMQKWDISVVTRNGRTEVLVGRDRRDPALTAVV
jgi:hypothetical protein